MPGICWDFPATEDTTMTGKLLLQGMMAGILAGIITFSFAHFFGEPQVERAILFEEGHTHKQGNEASGHHHEGSAEGEVFSRQTQSGAGLLSGMLLFSAAMGALWRWSGRCAGSEQGRAVQERWHCHWRWAGF
jgi:hypothetical protein